LFECLVTFRVEMYQHGDVANLQNVCFTRKGVLQSPDFVLFCSCKIANEMSAKRDLIANHSVGCPVSHASASRFIAPCVQCRGQGHMVACGCRFPSCTAERCLFLGGGGGGVTGVPTLSPSDQIPRYHRHIRVFQFGFSEMVFMAVTFHRAN
jgi:hypothetical protein